MSNLGEPLPAEFQGRYDPVFTGDYWQTDEKQALLDSFNRLGKPGTSSLNPRELVAQLFRGKSEIKIELLAELNPGVLFVPGNYDHTNLVRSSVEAMAKGVSYEELQTAETVDYATHYNDGYLISRRFGNQVLGEYYQGTAWHVLWKLGEITNAKPVVVQDEAGTRGRLSTADVDHKKSSRERVNVVNFSDHSFSGWRVGVDAPYAPETLLISTKTEPIHHRFRKSDVYKADHSRRPPIVPPSRPPQRPKLRRNPFMPGLVS